MSDNPQPGTRQDEAPGATEADRWAGETGEKWNTFYSLFESMLEPVGGAAIEHAGFKPGERVLDIGCGAGGTTLEIAGLVGPDGHVTGLDLNPRLIDTCRHRAEATGVTNVDFIAADAAEAQLSDYDHVFSRFGLMFFDQPYAAFGNIHDFLKPGGRFHFVCWGPPPDNPWASNMRDVAQKYVDLPQPDPKAPGPFAFADADYVRDILHQAGFRDIGITPWRGEQPLAGPGADAERAANFAMQALFLGDLLVDEPDEVREQAHRDMVEMLREYEQDNGVLLGCSAWLVEARS